MGCLVQFTPKLNKTLPVVQEVQGDPYWLLNRNKHEEGQGNFPHLSMKRLRQEKNDVQNFKYKVFYQPKT